MNLSSPLSRRAPRAASLAASPLVVLLALAGCRTAAPDARPARPAAVAPVAPEVPGLATYDEAVSRDPLKALDLAVANAGTDPAKVNGLVARLTEILRAPTTPFAARQAICERLGHLLLGASGGEVTAAHPTLAVLAPWLEDATLAPLALLALERVPGPAIDAMLRTAVGRASGPTRVALEHCLARRQPPAPPLVPAAPLPSLVADLGGSDPAKRALALQRLGERPAAAVSPVVAERLASWDAETQCSALELLGRLGHRSAVTAVVAATQHPDASVRLAAVSALGRLPGTPDVAQRLLDVTAGPSVEESKTALAALGRLNGPGIDDFLLAGARRGAASARVLCLRALAARYTLRAVPVAYQSRLDSETSVRSAALDLLADIAPFAEQAAVLEWTWLQTEDEDLTRAQRALIAVTLRAPAPADGIRVVLAALEKAAPAVQARQVRMLPRFGDAESLALAQRLAASTDTTVADAAKATVDRWPKPKEETK